MMTPRKPASQKQCNLETLLEALHAALLARAADVDAAMAYGRLLVAAKAYWPDLQSQLHNPHPLAQPVAVKGRQVR